MQTLNEKQVLVQDTKTGKQVILSKHFFERQKALKKNAFSDFEIVPSISDEISEPEAVKKPKKNAFSDFEIVPSISGEISEPEAVKKPKKPKKVKE